MVGNDNGEQEQYSLESILDYKTNSTSVAFDLQFLERGSLSGLTNRQIRYILFMLSISIIITIIRTQRKWTTLQSL